MKRYLVSYSTPEFELSQDKLLLSASEYGVDGSFSYTREWLETTDFYKKNKKILDEKRGAGYWVWKPYIILEAMKYLEWGDVLIYCDAGAEVINDVKPLVDLCIDQGGILLFNAVNKNKFYTKRDCFIFMGCDEQRYWNHPQFMGGYQVYLKSLFAIKFLEEYLKCVQVPRLADDSPSKTGNFYGFIEHRHDQSILSNLAIKYGIKGFRNPSQGGNYMKMIKHRVKGEFLLKQYLERPDLSSDYPTIFFNKRGAGAFRVALIKLRDKLRWQN